MFLLVLLSFQVEVMFMPGAKILMGAPKLDVLALASWKLELVTVIASLTRAVAGHVLAIVSGGYDDGNATVVKLKMESPVSGVAVVPSTRPIPLRQLYRRRQNHCHSSSEKQ